MDSKSILENALKLKPAERLQLIELLSKSLNEPNAHIEKEWSDEAEKRYEALISGKLSSYNLKEIIEKYK